MWFERFVIVVTRLYRDYLPSSWGTYRATRWDYIIYLSARWGLFTFLFFLFVRFLPMIPMIGDPDDAAADQGDAAADPTPRPVSEEAV